MWPWREQGVCVCAQDGDPSGYLDTWWVAEEKREVEKAGSLSRKTVLRLSPKAKKGMFDTNAECSEENGVVSALFCVNAENDQMPDREEGGMRLFHGHRVV